MQQEFEARWNALGAVISGLFNRVATLESQLARVTANDMQIGTTIANVEDVIAPLPETTVTTTTAVAGSIVAPDTPVEPVSSEEPVTPAATQGELDDEGVPWDERIHASTKSKVNSTEVKGGTKWRLKKGVDKDTAEKIKAEIRVANVTAAPAEAVAAATTFTTPAIPGAPAAPAAPSAPALPGAPVPETPAATGLDDANKKLRDDAIAIIKQLTDDYGLDVEDCKEILTNEFNAAQNGDQVLFGSVAIDQYQAVYDYFIALRDKYAFCQTATKRIYEIAGAPHKANVDQGVAAIYASAQTTELGGVHYTQIDVVTQAFDNWLKQWEAMANGA